MEIAEIVYQLLSENLYNHLKVPKLQYIKSEDFPDNFISDVISDI